MSTIALVMTALSVGAAGAAGALSAEHQAIYCGATGTETSLRYSQAVLSEVRGLEAKGLRGAQAWDAMTAQYCRGQEATR